MTQRWNRREEAIRIASRAVAQELFRTVAPGVLDAYDEAQRLAKPGALRDVKLGAPGESLNAAEQFLRAIAQAIRMRGGDIYGADSRPAGANVALTAVLESLSAPHQLDLVKHLLMMLPDVLRTTLDEMIPAISPWPVIDDVQRARLRNCVVRIEDGPHVSTGFAVSPDRYFLTPAHVALRPRRLQIAFLHGQHLEHRVAGDVDVVEIDQQSDTAILWAEEGLWEALQEAGLEPAPLSLDWKPRDSVFCMGYQEQQVSATPRTVGASIHPWDPRLRISFEAGEPGQSAEQQDCLVLSLPPMEAHIVHGMSGGAVLNARTNQIIGMVTGAEREAWIRSEVGGESTWILACPGYGFVVPLEDVEAAWPRLARYYA
jgi:S1-C subfamily serine protease